MNSYSTRRAALRVNFVAGIVAALTNLAVAQFVITDKSLEKPASEIPSSATPAPATSAARPVSSGPPLSLSLDTKPILDDLLRRPEFRAQLAGGPEVYYKAIHDGKYKEAEKLISEALDKTRSRDGLAAGYGAGALFYARAKKYDLALKSLANGALARPDSPLFPALEAWLDMETANMGAAEKAIEKARELDRDFLYTHVLRARLYASRMNRSAALEEWRLVKLRAPGFPDLAYNIAELELELQVSKGSRTYATPHFLVEYERAIGEKEDAIKTLTIDVDRARMLLDATFHFDSPEKTQLLVYTNDTFLQFFGNERVLGLFEYYDGLIRLRWGVQSPPEFRATVFHEYTHALLHKLTAGRLSISERWLHEGMAMWAEQFSGVDRMKGVPPDLRRALGESLPPFDEMDMGRFENYMRARIIVDEAILTFGQERWLDVFRTMGRGKLLDEAMKECLNQDYVHFETLIRQRLR